MKADRFWWQDGMQYRDLAKRLREMARRCTLPNPQRELLDLAQRYEGRANDMDPQRHIHPGKIWRSAPLEFLAIYHYDPSGSGAPTSP
jgi:hypothetical protein